MNLVKLGVASAGLFVALAVVVFALSGGLDSGASAAPQPKVALCHQTGSATNPWMQISVSGNAVDAHVRNHGDFEVATGTPCPPSGTATPTATATGVSGTATATATATSTGTSSPTATATSTSGATSTATATATGTATPTATPVP